MFGISLLFVLGIGIGTKSANNSVAYKTIPELALPLDSSFEIGEFVQLTDDAIKRLFEDGIIPSDILLTGDIVYIGIDPEFGFNLYTFTSKRNGITMLTSTTSYNLERAEPKTSEERLAEYNELNPDNLRKFRPNIRPSISPDDVERIVYQQSRKKQIRL